MCIYIFCLKEEEFEGTKGVIRIGNSKKNRQHNGQKTDNTMAKRQTTQWPKDRQHNGQKTDNTMAKRQTTQWPKEKRDKRTNKDPQKHSHKSKDRVTRTTLIPGGEHRCTGMKE